MTEDLSQLRKEILADLPKSRRPPAEGEPIPERGFTKGKGRVTPSGVFVSTNDIVESIRPLLNHCWTDGDIKRAMARKFGGKGISFRKHIALARRRNRESVSLDRKDCKASSVGAWSRSIAENQQKRAKCEQELAGEIAKLNALRQVFDEAGPAQFELALAKLNVQRSFVAELRRSISGCDSNVVSALHTLDRVLGNYAPMEHVDLTDRKNEIAHPTEPLTEKEADAALANILGRIREQITSDVKQEVAVPSSN